MGNLLFSTFSHMINLFQGLQGDLYYVRDGVPHSYALHFSLPIPADVNDIFFDWQSLRGPQEPGVC